MTKIPSSVFAAALLVASLPLSSRAHAHEPTGQAPASQPASQPASPPVSPPATQPVPRPTASAASEMVRPSGAGAGAGVGAGAGSPPVGQATTAGVVRPPAAEPRPVAQPTAGTVNDALSQGDSTTALARAQAARQANPSADSWFVEASVHDRMKAYAAAIAAYSKYLELSEASADPQRRADAGARINALQEASRGAATGEPLSSHRDRLDAERVARTAPAVVPASVPAPPPPANTADVRVGNKWYFWVTMAAIVASAGVISFVAIKASAEDQDDALTRGGLGLPPPGSPAMFRF